MFTVSRDFAFCYGHRLLNYNGKCAHLHGHNGTVRIVLASEKINEQGMVLDFADLKRTIGAWIDENLDHRMILGANDPLVSVLKEMGEPVFLVDANPTAEKLAQLIFEQVGSMGFPVQSVVFWETEKCFAEYRKSGK